MIAPIFLNFLLFSRKNDNEETNSVWSKLFSICSVLVIFSSRLFDWEKSLLLLITGMKSRRLKLKYQLYDVFISWFGEQTFANELLPLQKHFARNFSHSLSTLKLVSLFFSFMYMGASMNDPIPLHLVCRCIDWLLFRFV